MKDTLYPVDGFLTIVIFLLWLQAYFIYFTPFLLFQFFWCGKPHGCGFIFTAKIR